MIGGPQAWLGQTLWGRRIAYAICLALALFLLKTHVFGGYSFETAVTRIDVPLTCNRNTRGLLWRHPATRDFVPKDHRIDYCGLVWTEHGAFRLPHTHDMPLIQQSRKRLVGMLKPGCRYRIKVVGTRVMPSTDPGVERRLGKLVRAENADSACDAANQG